VTFPVEYVGVVVEGAVDGFCGRPRERNPYSVEYARDAYEAWEWGWDEARFLLELRGQEEASRWLQEVA
jgi:hypothetical protein